MSFSFSTTDGQSRYVRFDLLGENKQRSPFPPREFPKSPKPPTTNRGNYMESRFLTISREVTWLILSLPNLCITPKSQLVEMWRKASEKKMKKVLRRKSELWLPSTPVDSTCLLLIFITRSLDAPNQSPPALFHLNLNRRRCERNHWTM